MFISLIVGIIILSTLLLFHNFRANKNILFLFSVFMLLGLYALTHYVMSISKSVFFGAVLYINFTPLYLLIGPFLFFYVRNTLKDVFKFSLKDFLHFIPFVIHLVGLLSYLFTSFEYKKGFIENLFNNNDLIFESQPHLFFGTQENFVIRLGLLLIYCLVNLYLVIKYFKKTKHFVLYSKKEKRTLLWLTILNFYIITIVLVYTSFVMKLFNYPGDVFNLKHDILLIICTFCIFLMIASLLLFPHILYGISIKNHTVVSVQKKSNKNTQTPTESDQVYFKNLKKRILAYLDEEKPYLNTDFKITDLSKKTETPLHHIRYCLKYHMKKSFTEIKTEMRINWAKKALQDENYNTKTIDAIGQLCGYKSKSSFYSAFKEVTNYTPQEFKKSK